MFNRFVRLVTAFFSKFVTAAEYPVTILENNIREMRDSVPRLNEALARAQGSVILLEKELLGLEKEQQMLRAKLKAAAISNEDDLGRNIALELQRNIDATTKQSGALESAKQGLASMKELRDTQMRKIQMETEKIKDVIKDARVAKLQGELASLFETFQVGDVAYSNEDMIKKLEEESALNRGKLEVASDSYDMKSIRLEQKAEEIQAESLYEQFKHEMGIAAPDKESGSKDKVAQKTIG